MIGKRLYFHDLKKKKLKQQLKPKIVIIFPSTTILYAYINI